MSSLPQTVTFALAALPFARVQHALDTFPFSRATHVLKTAAGKPTAEKPVTEGQDTFKTWTEAESMDVDPDKEINRINVCVPHGYAVQTRSMAVHGPGLHARVQCAQHDGCNMGSTGDTGVLGGRHWAIIIFLLVNVDMFVASYHIIIYYHITSLTRLSS